MRGLRRPYLLAVSAAALLAVGAFALPLFLPETATRVDETLDHLGDPAEITVLKRGAFRDGDRAHHVAGQVALLEVDGAHHLRFTDYEQTAGPDVYLYLTHRAVWDEETVTSGLRVLLDGGAGDGRSTKLGNFTQRLPDGLDPEAYHGVAVWCERFGVLFGSAVLTS